MGTDFKDDKKKLTARLNAVKGYLENKERNIKQDVNNLGDNFFDKTNMTTQKLGSVLNDSAKNLPSANVFEELVNLLSTSITNDNLKVSNTPQKFHHKSAALQAAAFVGRKMNEIVRDEFLRGLYVSTQLGCGVDSQITQTSIHIKPSEFDLFEMLKIDPASSVGKSLYETNDFLNDPTSLNRMFYTTFNGTTADIFSLNNTLMFSVVWEETSQSYLISNIMNRNVYNLIVEYFLTVTLFDQKNLYAIIVALLTGVISLDNHTVYMNHMNLLNRLITKIFSHCQEGKNDNLKSDNLKEFDDLPFDVVDLFDFDEVEGLILEEEELRRNRVMKFADCGNLEVPVDAARVQEFLEDFDRNNNNGNHEYINNFLNDIAYHSFVHSNGSIPLELLKINTNKNFIKTLPKALALLLLTPKAIFPFVLIRRIFGAAAQEGTTLLKSIFKIIFRIIRKVFEEFVAEFFRLIKKELLRMIGVIIADALQELGIKRTAIIKQLLSMFRGTSSGSNLTQCGNMTKTILGLLSTATRTAFGVPTPLLIGAAQRSGFSNIRAFINVVEELDKVGIPTGDIYGQPNKHVIQHLAHIKGVERERDENGVVHATIISGTVPTPAGPGVIVPGTIKIVGING
jgi:hypothetical protein